jgi:hypothetical protein
MLFVMRQRQCDTKGQIEQEAQNHRHWLKAGLFTGGSTKAAMQGLQSCAAGETKIC